MKHRVMLTIASVLSLLLLTLHLTDDVVRGWFPGGLAVLCAALASGALLYGMLAFAGRRAGLVITVVVSLFVVAMPVLHTRGAGVGGVAGTGGGFFFVWTLVALGMLGTFSCILSVRGLWQLRSGELR